MRTAGLSTPLVLGLTNSYSFHAPNPTVEVVVAKNKVLEATNKVVAVLQRLKGAERTRALDAALSILGDAPRESGVGRNENSGGRGHATPAGGQAANVTSKSYMDRKAPETKVEELAV